MIRTNLKKNKLIKKLVGEFGNEVLLKRKLNILKIFLLRLKLRKVIRVSTYRLRFLWNNVYRKRRFWTRWTRNLRRWKKWHYKPNLTDKKFLTKFFDPNFKQCFYKFKRGHLRMNVLKLFATRFFDRPIYFKYRTKYCRYFLKRQKFRLMYGFLKIKPLRNIVQKSLKYQNALEVFLYFMESRLDVLMYRLKLTTSVRSSRQFILHGKVLVNGKVVRSAGYNIKKNDILTFKPELIYLFKKGLLENIKKKKRYKIRFPNYIEYSLKNFLFKFTILNRYDVRFIVYKTKIHSFMALLNFYNKCLF